MHAEGNCRWHMPTTTIVPMKSRHNTVSGAVNANVNEEIEEAKNPSFPLAEHYPFTLLHKLSAGKLFSSFFFLIPAVLMATSTTSTARPARSCHPLTTPIHSITHLCAHLHHAPCPLTPCPSLSCVPSCAVPLPSRLPNSHHVPLPVV